MEFHAEGDPADLAVASDLDVRSVSVLWVDQQITVDFTNCSAYEALGLMRTGVLLLEQDCVEGARFLDDEEEEEEDDDDE